MSSNKSYDFSKMTIDLSKLSAGQSFLEVFPHYSHKQAYTQATDNEIKVAIAMCDPGGPFALIRRYKDRLDAIFEYWKLDSAGADKELYESILTLKSDNVAHIWTDHLASVFDHEWTSWFSNSVLYYQLQEQIRIPINFQDPKADSQWKARIDMESKADSVYKRMKSMEEIIFVDSSIRKRSNEKQTELIVNYAEKHSQSNSVI